MQARDKWVHFVMSQEELERMQQKMDELGIRNKSSYLRKMALDGYCVNLELDDVKEMVSLLRYCSNNLNQYAKRANETGSRRLAHQTPISSSLRLSAHFLRAVFRTATQKDHWTAVLAGYFAHAALNYPIDTISRTSHCAHRERHRQSAVLQG